MSKFKLNARAFGGLGLLLIVVVLIAPLYAGLIETGVVGNIPSNIIQTEEGVRHQLPTTPSIVLLVIMVISFIAFVFLYRHKKRRER